MANKNIQIKDPKTGDNLYPITSTSNVKNNQNVNVETMIQTLEANKSDKSYTNQLSNPNLLINGDFRVNQRGQTTYTFEDDTAAYIRHYTVDRWRFVPQVAHSTSSVTVNDNSITMQSSNRYDNISQYIEDFKKFENKTITISAKIKTIRNRHVLRVNVDGSIYSNININNTGITSITTTLASIQSSLQITIIADAADNSTIEIEYVKLEIGSVATPYSPRPYAEELAMCQRYYYKIKAKDRGVNSAYAELAMGWITNDTTSIINFGLPTEMRTIPTITYSNLSDFIVRKAGTITPITPTTINLWTFNGCSIMLRMITASLGVSWGIATFRPKDNTNGEINLDAEIY